MAKHKLNRKSNTRQSVSRTPVSAELTKSSPSAEASLGRNSCSRCSKIKRKRQFYDFRFPHKVFKTCRRCRYGQNLRYRNLHYRDRPRQALPSVAAHIEKNMDMDVDVEHRSPDFPPDGEHVLPMDTDDESDVVPPNLAISSRQRDLVLNMRRILDAMSLGRCDSCREQGFHISNSTMSDQCRRCRLDKRKDGKLWSDENNVNPPPQPDCLKGLTDVEEMLIARVKPIMHVRYTTGRQLSYKDHIINLPQDITDIAQRLPRLPQDLDIVIIRREGDELDHHVDYLCRRRVVYDALRYKIGNDPNYADLGCPDQDALECLPLHGSVLKMISSCSPPLSSHTVHSPTGPTDACFDNHNSGDNLDEQTLAGVLNFSSSSLSEIDGVRQGVSDLLSRHDHGNTFVVNAPVVNPSQPINESTDGYMAMAFPTLFPDGSAQFNQPRLHKIHLGEYFKHLLSYADGRFARHRRFPWFMFNTLQRHRTRAQSKVFVKQNLEDSRMSIADIKQVLLQGDSSIAHNMVRYGASLRGTRAYWLARRRELLDMIRVRGSPNLFFTLSAADLQWHDLHRHMPVENPPGDDPTGKIQRRMALNNNPHLAASYLHERFLVFMTQILKPLFLVSDYWTQYEWQERGSGHIHGFLWMTGAPDPDQIDWTVLKTDDRGLSHDQKKRMEDFISFWSKFVTAVNPFPRTDENVPLVGDHPCQLPNDTLVDSKEQLSHLLNWVERHRICHPGYCQVIRKVPGHNEKQSICRFDFPMELSALPTVGLDSKHRPRFEPERNDPLLNSFNVAMILAWRANIDVKPVLSKDAAINYIAKYASKAETQAAEFPALLASVTENIDPTSSSQLACQKFLNKMLGERCYSAQETAHLLLGLPLITTSVTFQTLNINSNGCVRELSIVDNVVDEDGEQVVTHESCLQRYQNRPLHMESLSLYDVMVKFFWGRGQWRKRKDSTMVILRVFPRLSPNPDDSRHEEYCRIKMLLHHPFREVDNLRHHADIVLSWAEAFSACLSSHNHPRDCLRSWQDELHNSQDDDDDDDEELERHNEEIAEADWQTWARDHPHSPIPLFTFDDLGKRPLDDAWDVESARRRWNNIEHMASYLDVQKKNENIADDKPELVDLLLLTEEQRTIFDSFVSCYNKILIGDDHSPCLLNIDGTAGCGKTFLIKAICQELRRLAAVHERPDPVRIIAPSGVAALNIFGRTIHSALGLPISRDFSPLTGSRLASFQLLWKDVHFIIIDEKSMLGLRTLGQMDSRLKQLRPSDIELGGFHVALFGDFAQLPPMGDTPLYGMPSSANNDNGAYCRTGALLYRLFHRNFSLSVVLRQAGDNQRDFRALLYHASVDGGLNASDWAMLKKRHQSQLSSAEIHSFDNSPSVYTTRKEVDDHNLMKIVALNVPCTRILAKHDGGHEARHASPDLAAGLESELVLAIGACVMITRNLWQGKGLVNATIGHVEDIVWDRGAQCSELPLAVLVSSPEYNGPTMWHTEPRAGFPQGLPVFPICPMKTSFESQSRPMARTQLPLRLAWAITVHKSQGLTLPRIRLGLGEREFSCGLTFVALSRTRSIDGLLLIGNLTWERVRKLGGKFLELRLQDVRRRFPEL